MRVYLINKNPVVAKLVALSVAKANLELIESPEIDVTLEAEIVFIDDECYDEELIDTYKQNFGNAKISLLHAKSSERIAGFDEYIQKPFLPTDLFDVLVKLSGITPNDIKQPFDEVSNESMDLDFDDDIHELGSLQILDKDDIDEVKGLFDDNEDSLDLEVEDTLEAPEVEDLELPTKEKEEGLELKLPEDIEDLEPLSKEKEEGLGDLEAKDELDAKLEDMQEDLNAEDSLDMPDLEVEDTLEAPEVEEIELLEDDKESSREESDLKDVEDLELASKEQEKEALENIQEKTPKKELNQEEDLDLNFLEDIEAKDELEDLNIEDSLDLADLEVEGSLAAPKVEDVELLEDDKKSSKEESDLKDIEDLELPAKEQEEDLDLESSNEDMDLELEDSKEPSKEALDLSPEEDLETKDKESKKDKISSDVDALESEFGALNLEGISEALGEPIAKEPNIAPIVSQSKKEDALPNVQTNSLEGLITALQTLQKEALKDILSGAVININIQFPKKDDN